MTAIHSSPADRGGGASDPDDGVTVIVDWIPKHGRAANLEAAVRDLTTAMKNSPGHRAVIVVRPCPPAHNALRMVHSFETLSDFRAWEQTEECRRHFAAAEEHSAGKPKRTVETGLEAWFTLPGDHGAMPPRYKMAVVMFLAMYPTGYAIHALLVAMPGFGPLPDLVHAALITAGTVAATTYIALPWLNRVLSFWLHPKPADLKLTA